MNELFLWSQKITKIPDLQPWICNSFSWSLKQFLLTVSQKFFWKQNIMTTCCRQFCLQLSSKKKRKNLRFKFWYFQKENHHCLENQFGHDSVLKDFYSFNAQHVLTFYFHRAWCRQESHLECIKVHSIFEFWVMHSKLSKYRATTVNFRQARHKIHTAAHCMVVLHTLA